MTYVLFLRNKNTLIFHTVSTSLHTSHSTIIQTGFCFFFKNYFKHGFWIIFLLLLLFFFTIILSEKTRPFKNICQFYTKQFQDLCWTKSSTEMLQNFSCENTFLYDLNFELLQGQINPLKLRINKGEKNWVFFFIPKMW